MPFPISLQGRLRLDFRGDPEIVADAIHRRLLDERPIAMGRVGRRVEFVGGIGAGGLSGWALLMPISKGTVEVASVPPTTLVRYELRYTQRLVVVSALTFGFFAPVLLLGARVSLLEAALVSCAAWLWLFGAGYATSAFRFRAFLRRATLPIVA
jgi:hypothetical protein